MSSSSVIEHGSSRPGRWLQQRRLRVSLWVAVAEGILVAVMHDVTRWTVIGVAILAVALYAFAGRKTRSDTLRQLSWIFAFSQALAVVVSILTFVVFWFALIVIVLFAVVALFFLFTDR